MKKTLCAMVLLVVLPATTHADERLLLNAFGETATAYLNDAFLLIGTTADSFVAEVIPKDTALQIVTNVQKRVQLIRAKFRSTATIPMSDVDRNLFRLLDSAYASMDNWAWALQQYVKDMTPDASKRFKDRRIECLTKIEEVSSFYAKLPPFVEPPRSTR